MKKANSSVPLTAAAILLLGLFLVLTSPNGEIPLGARGKLLAAEVPEGQAAPEQFSQTCGACHPGGGNVFKPYMPLKEAPQLEDFNAFVAYLRNPKPRDGSDCIMPAYPLENFSDRQAREIYQEIIRLREND
jgi:mono/diheme cytochrome c family protein